MCVITVLIGIVRLCDCDQLITCGRCAWRGIRRVIEADGIGVIVMIGCMIIDRVCYYGIDRVVCIKVLIVCVIVC